MVSQTAVPLRMVFFVQAGDEKELQGLTCSIYCAKSPCRFIGWRWGEELHPECRECYSENCRLTKKIKLLCCALQSR